MFVNYLYLINFQIKKLKKDKLCFKKTGIIEYL